MKKKKNKMYKLQLQHFKIVMFLYYFFKICKMVQLKEEQRIQICTLLDEKLYSPSDLAKEYKVSPSTITRLYEKYQKTNEVKNLSKTGRPQLINERREHQVI